MNDELYQELKDYIRQSTSELENTLLVSLEQIAQQQPFTGQSNVAPFNIFTDNLFGQAISTLARGRNVTLQQLGRNIVSHAGRSVGTDIGNAVSAVLFGSTSKTAPSSRQFSDTVFNELFK